jgi:hypothetical protein
LDRGVDGVLGVQCHSYRLLSEQKQHMMKIVPVVGCSILE